MTPSFAVDSIKLCAEIVCKEPALVHNLLDCTQEEEKRLQPKGFQIDKWGILYTV